MNNSDKLAKLAVNKSLLKEFHNSQNERIVYLNDGQEFQIQIFNPYQYIIGVSFSFNSDNINNSKLLVLKPGERVWLERYLDSSNKFVFSTYEVGASKEVKKAIEKNGILNIYFYKEKEKQNNIWISTTSITNEDLQPYTYPNWKDNIIYCDNNVVTSNLATHINDSINTAYYSSLPTPKSTCAVDSTCIAASTNTAANYGTSRYLNTADIKVGTNSCVNERSIEKTCLNKNSIETTCLNKKSIETGRIDKGSYSTQNFNNYYGNFESWYFKKETIHILPTSQKQVSSNDLKKQYCHNCGRKLNQKFKFCPYCGAKQ